MLSCSFTHTSHHFQSHSECFSIVLQGLRQSDSKAEQRCNSCLSFTIASNVPCLSTPGLVGFGATVSCTPWRSLGLTTSSLSPVGRRCNKPTCKKSLNFRDAHDDECLGMNTRLIPGTQSDAKSWTKAAYERGFRSRRGDSQTSRQTKKSSAIPTSCLGLPDGRLRDVL